MTTTKFDNPWGNAGDLGDAIKTAKQDSGFTNLDKPTYQRLNKLLNRSETKQNQIITEGPNGTYDNATDVGGMIATGLWDENWGVVDESGGKNLFNIAGVTALTQVQSYIDSDEVRHVLFADYQANKIHSLNATTEVTTSSTDLSTNFPAASGNWVLQSFVTDGTHVYCCFRDTGDNTGRMQSFLISDWSEHIAWPSTGVALATGSVLYNTYVRNLCFANATQIAIAQTGVACVTNASECIKLIAIADGTLVATGGAGDCPAANGNIPTGQICSDGTNLFFSVDSGTTPVFALCTATIADLTAGTGGTGYPLSKSQTAVLCSAGKMIFSAVNNTTPAKSTGVLSMGNASYATLDVMSPGEDPNTLNPEDIIYGGVIDMVFDGSNLWLMTPITGNGGSQYGLLKIDTAKFSGTSRSTSPYWRTLIDVTNGVTFLTDNIHRSMTFDGRDIWTSSDSVTFNITRFPLAMLRG